MITTREQLKSKSKQMFDEMEQRLLKDREPSDSLFYYHPNESRIVLSHALFWVMSKPFENSLKGNKALLLLRLYEERMLDAYLTESDEYSELLRYCNICFECLPFVLNMDIHDPKKGKNTQKLSVTAMVAVGYGGDMDDELADELLDDMDFYYSKVCCRKIEQLLPQLTKMVEHELKDM